MAEMNREYIFTDREKFERKFRRIKEESSITRSIGALCDTCDVAKEIGGRWRENAQETAHHVIDNNKYLRITFQKVADLEKGLDKIWDYPLTSHTFATICGMAGVDTKLPAFKDRPPTIGSVAEAYFIKKAELMPGMLEGSTPEDQEAFKERIPNPQMRKMLVAMHKGEKLSNFLTFGTMAKAAVVSALRPDGTLHKVIRDASFCNPVAAGVMVAYDAVWNIGEKNVIPFFKQFIKPVLESVYQDYIEPARNEMHKEDAEKKKENDENLSRVTDQLDDDNPSRALEDLLRVYSNGGMSKDMLKGLRRCLDEQEHHMEGHYLEGNFDDLNYQEAQGYRLGRGLLAAGLTGAALAGLLKNGLLKSKEPEKTGDDVPAPNSVLSSAKTSSEGVGSYAAGSIGDIKQRLQRIVNDLIPKVNAVVSHVEGLDVDLALTQDIVTGSSCEQEVIDRIIIPMTQARNSLQDIRRSYFPQVDQHIQEWINRK